MVGGGGGGRKRERETRQREEQTAIQSICGTHSKLAFVMPAHAELWRPCVHSAASSQVRHDGGHSTLREKRLFYDGSHLCPSAFWVNESARLCRAYSFHRRFAYLQCWLSGTPHLYWSDWRGRTGCIGCYLSATTHNLLIRKVNKFGYRTKSVVVGSGFSLFGCCCF